MKEPARFPCHLCGAGVRPLENYPLFCRVTSDCQPWNPGGALGICSGCGGLVVRADAAWRQECERIYTEYRIYHQSGGAEQVVAQASAEPVGRSQALLEHLHANLPVPTLGRLLDVGCGNGGFLRSFTRRFPGWTAVGSEFDAKHRQEVEAIPGVEKLHVGPVENLSGGFDLISLVHVLEHIENPVGLLESLRRLLRPGGRLLVQLPYYVLNPVELLIADHATHFSTHSLRRLLERSGWRVRVMTSDWIAKELSCVAEFGPPADSSRAQTPQAQSPVAPDDERLPEAAIRWISSFSAAAHAAAAEAQIRGGPLGIFGTAIAGIWLAGELGEKARFFVDEDPDRVGKTLQGLPVLAPSSLPAGATVFMGVSPVIAHRIAERIQRENLFLVPPPANPC